MVGYLSRRAVQAVATIFVVVTAAFAFGRLSGSPAALLLTENATAEQIADLNHRLGFDLPMWQQYVQYLGGLLVGDFGESYRQAGVSSMHLVLERLPASLYLGSVGLLLGVALSLIAGLGIQLTGSRGLRTLSLGLGSLRQAIPDFFFGLLCVLLFSVTLGLLPSLGNRDPLAIIMPAVTIATGQYVLYTRLIDNSLTEQSSMDYARTAYARGETKFHVVVRELLPNAFLPVLTVAGISLGSFLGGLVIVENVFAWPGMGQLMLGAVYSRDFPVVQSGLIVVALLFVGANFLIDIVYGLIDPRVRIA